MGFESIGKQIGTLILEVNGYGVVRLCEDIGTNSYSIGLTTKGGFQWKYISEELHTLLVKELKERKGFGIDD